MYTRMLSELNNNQRALYHVLVDSIVEKDRSTFLSIASIVSIALDVETIRIAVRISFKNPNSKRWIARLYLENPNELDSVLGLMLYSGEIFEYPWVTLEGLQEKLYFMRMVGRINKPSSATIDFARNTVTDDGLLILAISIPIFAA